MAASSAELSGNVSKQKIIRLLSILDEVLANSSSLRASNTIEDALHYMDAKELARKLSFIYRTDGFVDSSKLITILEQRWDKVKGTFLSYTSNPDTTVTNLCLEVAKYLHYQDSSRKVYQYLMPTITAIKEMLGLYNENIDDYGLHEIIISDDFSSIIPARIILDIAIESKDSLDGLRLPYVACDIEGEEVRALSENEKFGLINHSQSSKAYFDLCLRIIKAKRRGVSLGAEINQLIVLLRKGGEHGGEGGTARLATPAAHNAFEKFCQYWQMLDEETMRAVRQCSANGISLGYVIDTLSGATAALTCVEINANKLDLILKNNQSYLYSVIAPYETNDSLNQRFDSLCLGPLLQLQTDAALLQSELESKLRGFEKHAKSGSVSSLVTRQLCDVGTDIHLAISHCITLLILALRNRDLVITEEIAVIASGMGIFECVLDRIWCHAVEKNDLNLVREILTFGRDINIPSLVDGKTPLIRASYLGHKDIVNLLLDTGRAAINAADSMGRTALSWAAANGNAEVVQRLLDIPGIEASQADHSDLTPLHLAHCSNHTKIVTLFLNASTYKLDKDHFFCVPLIWAVEHERADIVDFLLNNVPELHVNECNAYGNTPLHIAVRHGFFTIALLLLSDPRVDINKRDRLGDTALHIAVNRNISINSLNILELLLLSPSADVNGLGSNGKTALMTFIKSHSQSHYGEIAAKKKRCIKLLLSSPKINVNQPDRVGRTALYWAFHAGYEDAISELLASPSIDKQPTNCIGKSPLYSTAGRCDRLILHLLGEITDINSPDSHGRTPLWWAIEAEDYFAVSEILAVKGVDIERMDDNGMTPIVRLVYLYYLEEIDPKFFKDVRDLLEEQTETSSRERSTTLPSCVNWKEMVIYAESEGNHFIIDPLLLGAAGIEVNDSRNCLSYLLSNDMADIIEWKKHIAKIYRFFENYISKKDISQHRQQLCNNILAEFFTPPGGKPGIGFLLRGKRKNISSVLLYGCLLDVKEQAFQQQSKTYMHRLFGESSRLVEGIERIFNDARISREWQLIFLSIYQEMRSYRQGQSVATCFLPTTYAASSS